MSQGKDSHSELSNGEGCVTWDYGMRRGQTKEGAALLILADLVLVTGTQEDMERDIENKRQICLEWYRWGEGELHFMPYSGGLSILTQHSQSHTPSKTLINDDLWKQSGV